MDVMVTQQKDKSNKPFECLFIPVENLGERSRKTT